jgi:hypothetical protein
VREHLIALIYIFVNKIGYNILQSVLMYLKYTKVIIAQVIGGDRWKGCVAFKHGTFRMDISLKNLA